MDILADKFELPRANTFQKILESYDRRYGTVRSYNYEDIDPDSIILDAAEQGNIEAFYKGLRLYPEYRDKRFYDEALFYAAKGNNLVIIDLLKELGANSFENMLKGAIIGGHLDLVRSTVEAPRNERRLFTRHIRARFIIDAIYSKHLDIIKYIHT